MRRTYLLPALAVLALPLIAQRNFDEVKIETTKVAGSVYMLTGAGGNIGVSVGEDGIVIVDDQFAPLAPKIKAALAAITDRPIQFVLNTHYHGDHTGGNEIFGREAPIIAHDNVRQRLAAGTTARGHKTPPAPKGALPVVTFDSTLTIHVNGEQVRAIHSPHAHTDGDSIIWFTRSNVVHMGDNFFNGRFPYIDVDNGGSARGLIHSIDRVLSTVPDDAKIIPGHGPLADKAALRRYSEMLAGTYGAVDAAVRAGKTLDQMKREKVLGPWEEWDGGFISSDAFLTTLHGELTR
ncbi:MAG TPA: MBL fold metallo-hydrolase [Thermoanaerobaculia bacterium]|nr:MBL fold metallo-hydrolase [Thermoanaerobaculia bacterium]